MKWAGDLGALLLFAPRVSELGETVIAGATLLALPLIGNRTITDFPRPARTHIQVDAGQQNKGDVDKSSVDGRAEDYLVCGQNHGIILSRVLRLSQR